MSTAERTEDEVEPIIIHRSANRDGATFAVDHRSLKRLREAFGPAVHARKRIFLTHEKPTELNLVQEGIAPHIVTLLTGLTEEQLKPLGGVIFQDPVTEEDLPRTAA
jgi:hypothetical protein